MFYNPLLNAKPVLQILKLYVKGLKRYANLYISLLLSTSPVFTSLAQAVTSQTESRKPLKRALIVIIPKYLFEINGFGIYLISLTKEKYNIYDK